MLSHYQEAIITAIKDGTDNLLVQATPGSGKSFTIVESTKSIRPEISVGVMAFGVEIAASIKPKIKHPRADVRTINSYGAQVMYKNFGRTELDAFKTRNTLKMFFDMSDKKEVGKYYKAVFAVERLVELLRANLVFPDAVTGDVILDMAETYGLDLPSEGAAFLELVSSVYARCSKNRKIIDFRDQVFMPIFLDLDVIPLDIALVDEVQDLDPGQAELMIRAAKRFVGVGDENQAIYMFKGAMSDAMTQMRKRFSAQQLPLSICYRCPKRVIELLQQIVPEIEPWDRSPDGIVDSIGPKTFWNKAESGDFVLCRTNAPLVSWCLRMIRENRKAYVRGKDIGVNLNNLIDKLVPDPRGRVEFLISEAQKHLDQQITYYGRIGKEDRLIEIQDKIETILVLVEGCDTVAEVKIRINGIFQAKGEGVVFMSMHKAKGLEAGRVFILERDKIPHKRAKTPEQLKQERNLFYVAQSRAAWNQATGACGELYFVDTKIQEPDVVLRRGIEQPQVDPYEKIFATQIGDVS